jgi:hypothetical protein
LKYAVGSRFAPTLMSVSSLLAWFQDWPEEAHSGRPDWP